MSVFGSLAGQADAVETLTRAARDARAIAAGEAGSGAMTHAWLFSGPPGSGRSVAARAFAAALQCPDGGCGHCHACHTALEDTHPDVTSVVPTGLSIKVEEARGIIMGSARLPQHGRWQVTLIEDADRLTEEAQNALLKGIEEPPARSVLLLCAPTADELLPTIRSRCRLVSLRIPSVAAVTEVLQRAGVDEAMAAWAARAGQGHVGRARRLATDPEARSRRREVLALPRALGAVSGAFAAADALVAACTAEATELLEGVAEAEVSELTTALGGGGSRGKGRPSTAAPRGSAGAISELEKRQKSRVTRTKRDALDRGLTDLAAFYRDVLTLQLGAGVPLVHGDHAQDAQRLAASSSPESTLRRIEAVMACRAAIGENVATLLAVEAMALSLHEG